MKISKAKPNHKFLAKKDTRLYVLGREKRTVFVVDVKKEEKFKLRKGQTFFEGIPHHLKEI